MEGDRQEEKEEEKGGQKEVKKMLQYIYNLACTLSLSRARLEKISFYSYAGSSDTHIMVILKLYVM